MTLLYLYLGFIINHVFVICLCIFDYHIVFQWLWQAIPSNTYTWTWSVCLSNSVFVVLYVFVFVFVCLFICVCICDTVTARQWPLLQGPPMLTPCLTASSLLSNLSQIHVLPHTHIYSFIETQKYIFIHCIEIFRKKHVKFDFQNINAMYTITKYKGFHKK